MNMRILTMTALPLLLAACSQDENAPVDSTVEQVTPGETVADLDGVSLADPAPGSVTAPATAIPAAMQGRWGMTANDCDPARSDNKGLMVVGPDSLQFYESRGSLDQVTASGLNEVRARFSYTGEGMAWEREELLQLQDGGQALTRRQFGEEGEQGPFTYRRCA